MMMYWEWFCSLFRTKERQTIDPYLWRCSCGFTWKFSRFELLWMFLHDDYTFTCPHCQRQSRYRMITHVVRETDTDEIREHNRWLK